MDAKQMLKRLEQQDAELDAHLDALAQVVPTMPIFDAGLAQSASTMLKAHMQANFQTLGVTLGALGNAQRGYRQAAAGRPQETVSKEIVDVEVREVPDA